MKTNEAIAKITSEMMKLNEPFAQAIEEHLTQICTNDRIAECILQEDKTLAGAMAVLWKEAEKNMKREKNTGIAVMNPEDAYSMVEEYFGITPDMKKATRAAIVNILDEI